MGSVYMHSLNKIIDANKIEASATHFLKPHLETIRSTAYSIASVHRSTSCKFLSSLPTTNSASNECVPPHSRGPAKKKSVL